MQAKAEQQRRGGRLLGLAADLSVHKLQLAVTVTPAAASLLPALAVAALILLIAAARRARDPVAVDPASSRPKKHETRLGEWEEPGRKTRELRGAARARKETKRFGV